METYTVYILKCADNSTTLELPTILTEDFMNTKML